MTLLPHANRDVKGVEGEPYRLTTLCANPLCSHVAGQRHHLWRRSFLCGPYDWVELWDGTVIGNIVGLCWYCHNNITENKKLIWFNSTQREFLWRDIANLHSFPLRTQPPTKET